MYYFISLCVLVLGIMVIIEDYKSQFLYFTTIVDGNVEDYASNQSVVHLDSKSLGSMAYHIINPYVIIPNTNKDRVSLTCNFRIHKLSRKIEVLPSTIGTDKYQVS